MIYGSSLIALGQAAEPVSRTPLYVIIVYMCALFALGWMSSRMFRGSSKDFFVASRSIGPFMLLMSVFGTTMTAFALVGSTSKAFSLGIGTYGLMASSSGLIHTACFFLVGIKMWSFGKKYGYVTQIQFFRDRFESKGIGYLMFPILVGLIIPYLLVGLMGAGIYIEGITRGMFPETFTSKLAPGAVPNWLTGLVICFVVLFYVFFGGVRSAAWANTFQTIVFMIMGLVGFIVIAKAIGGLTVASEITQEYAPNKLAREGLIEVPHFISYMLIPLSVGMFPHLFQHWLTAKSAKSFRLTVIAHPICIMIVWVPCILIGIWAAGLHASGELFVPPKTFPGPDGIIGTADDIKGLNANAVLGVMVKKFMNDPLLIGLFSAGVMAAIMSSLDSQFVCIGSMFTNDFIVPLKGEVSDKQKVWLGRSFIVFIVLVSYLISVKKPMNVFNLGVWCFSGFAALFPIAFASVYWKRVTAAGVFASVIATVITWAMFIYDALGRDSGEQWFGVKEHGEYLIAGVMPVTFIFLASVAALIGVSLMTKAPSQSTIDRFFPTKKA